MGNCEEQNKKPLRMRPLRRPPLGKIFKVLVFWLCQQLCLYVTLLLDGAWIHSMVIRLDGQPVKVHAGGARSWASLIAGRAARTHFSKVTLAQCQTHCQCLGVSDFTAPQKVFDGGDRLAPSILIIYEAAPAHPPACVHATPPQ